MRYDDYTPEYDEPSTYFAPLPFDVPDEWEMASRNWLAAQPIRLEKAPF